MASIKNARRRRGLAVVEAAIIMNVLLLVVLGVLEYGWMFMVSDEIHNAARQGARLAVLPDATASSVKSAVETVLTNSKLQGTTHTVTITPTDPMGVTPGNNVKVEITLNYVSLTHFVPTPGTLRASVIMAKEGP